MDIIGNNDRVASALETDGVDVHDNVTEVADHLSVFLVITGLAADIACVKTDTVGRRIRLLNNDETDGHSVVRRIAEPVKMSVTDHLKRNIYRTIFNLGILDRGQFDFSVSYGIDDRHRENSEDDGDQSGVAPSADIPPPGEDLPVFGIVAVRLVHVEALHPQNDRDSQRNDERCIDEPVTVVRGILCNDKQCMIGSNEPFRQHDAERCSDLLHSIHDHDQAHQ